MSRGAGRRQGRHTTLTHRSSDEAGECVRLVTTIVVGGAGPRIARLRSFVAGVSLVAVAAGCDSATVTSGHVRAWSAAQVLEEDHSQEDNHPAVAINATGGAVVAWQRGNSLWARLYDGALQTFGAASLVATPSRYDDLQVGIDAQGTAMMLWARDDADDTRGVWWSRTTDHGASWSMPAMIAAGDLHRTRLAVSGAGAALAAWTARSDDHVVVTVGSCDFRDGVWNTVVNTPLPGTGLGDRNPRVAMDGNGRGFLTWEQPAVLNEPSSVWTERYDGTWLPESLAILDANRGDDSYTPTLALNDAGAGTAIWLQMQNFVPQLWSRRFDGKSWGEAEHLATAPLIEWDPPPRVAVDPVGGSVALWSEVTDLAQNPQYYDVHAVRTAAGATPWQAPEVLETNNLIGADLTEYAEPLVGMDGAGNAIATWRKELPSSAIQVSWVRFAAGGTAWAPPNGAPLHDDPTHSAFATDLAVSRNGTALAAWSYGPEFDIWVSVYR